MEAAAREGLLTETHHVELKRELGPSGKGTNREAAKDMSALSLDGGALLYGVDEAPDGPPQLYPVPLEGLRERLAQIALTRCDPPLHVTTRQIADPADATVGVVIVEVPASADAPHMVDGRYFGRSDTTTYQLGDAEVEWRIRARAARVVDADRTIDAEVADDPLGSEQPLGRLYVVADPVAARPGLLEDHLFDRGFQDRIATPVGPVSSGPHWGYLNRGSEPRADGRGWSSYGISGRRRSGVTDEPTDMLDVEITWAGRVRTWATGLNTDVRNGLVIGGSVETVDELAARRLVGETLEVAAEISRVSGYGGRWSVTVGLVGIRGRASFSRGYSTALARFSGDRYVQQRTVAAGRLAQDVAPTTGALMDRLEFALGLRG